METVDILADATAARLARSDLVAAWIDTRRDIRAVVGELARTTGRIASHAVVTLALVERGADPAVLRALAEANGDGVTLSCDLVDAALSDGVDMSGAVRCSCTQLDRRRHG